MRETPDTFVNVKTIHTQKLGKRAREVIQELYLMKNIKHPAILNIQKIYRENEKLYIITPCFSGKNLKTFIKGENRLNERQIANIVQQILEITKRLSVDGIQDNQRSNLEDL